MEEYPNLNKPHNAFSAGDIIEPKGHLEEILEFHREGKLIDFLPAILTPTDHGIMKKWMNHFDLRGIPYVVTRRENGRKILWKEDVSLIQSKDGRWIRDTNILIKELNRE